MLTQKTTFTRPIGALLTYVIFALPIAAHSQSSQPLTTSAEALACAQKYCVAIGQPAKVGVREPLLMNAPSASTSASPLNSLIQHQTYWQSCWRLSLQDEVTVVISASIGVVCEYMNFGAMDKRAADNTPAEPALSEQKEISLAAAAIKATGQREELTFWGATLFGADAQVASEQRWVVRWRRTIHDIPYHDQHASVQLDPITGAVELAILKYPTPPFSGDLANLPISQNDAVKVATDCRDACGISLPFESAHLEIVQPNTLLDGPNPPAEADLTSHVAWVCQFTANNVSLDLWVDARTGALLGGETAQPMSVQPRRKLLKKLLSH